MEGRLVRNRFQCLRRRALRAWMIASVWKQSSFEGQGERGGRHHHQCLKWWTLQAQVKDEPSNSPFPHSFSCLGPTQMKRLLKPTVQKDPHGLLRNKIQHPSGSLAIQWAAHSTLLLGNWWQPRCSLSCRVPFTGHPAPYPTPIL